MTILEGQRGNPGNAIDKTSVFTDANLAATAGQRAIPFNTADNKVTAMAFKEISVATERGFPAHTADGLVVPVKKSLFCGHCDGTGGNLRVVLSGLTLCSACEDRGADSRLYEEEYSVDGTYDLFLSDVVTPSPGFYVCIWGGKYATQALGGQHFPLTGYFREKDYVGVSDCSNTPVITNADSISVQVAYVDATGPPIRRYVIVWIYYFSNDSILSLIFNDQTAYLTEIAFCDALENGIVLSNFRTYCSSFFNSHINGTATISPL